jgi:hypothetical protein
MVAPGFIAGAHLLFALMHRSSISDRLLVALSVPPLAAKQQPHFADYSQRMKGANLAGAVSGRRRIRKRPNRLLFFRVLDIAGLGLTIVCVLLSVAFVLWEFCHDVLRW